MRRKISWITFSSFLDTDISIVPYLSQLYIIDWVIILDKYGSTPNIPDLDKKSSVRFLIQPHRDRDVRNIFFWAQLCFEIKNRHTDVIYISGLAIPFFYPVLDCFFRENRIIHAAHNVIPYKGWPHKRLMSFYIKYVLSKHSNLHVFSSFLYEYLKNKYPRKNILYAPMGLKSFGKCPISVPKNSHVRFLFFGNVKPNKRLDLLINAFKLMPAAYREKSELLIAGKCDDKDFYLGQIGTEDRIKVSFERIDDSKIAILFSSYDFLVLPYENVAQSGPHMIAYNYNLPVIASNINGFKERIIDNENGYLFEVNNVNSLCSTLMKAIDRYDHYDNMKVNLSLFVEKNYSDESIRSKYQEYINEIISHNDTKNKRVITK